MRSYEITNADNGKLKEITKAEAIALLGADVTFTSVMAATDILKGATKCQAGVDKTASMFGLLDASCESDPTFRAPNGTALVTDTSEGKVKLDDEAINKLFVAKK